MTIESSIATETRRPRDVAAPAARHSMRQNALAMSIGQATTWGLAAVALALIPRYLGPDKVGELNIGNSLAGLGGTIAGLGMATLVTKEVARDRKGAGELLGTALWLNLALGILGAGVTAVVAGASGYSSSVVLIIAISCAAIPFTLVGGVSNAALQGLEVMRYGAILDVASKALSLVALLAIVLSGQGVVAVAMAILAISILTTVAQLAATAWLLHAKPIAFSRRAARRLVVGSLPFWGVAICFSLYWSVEVVLLSRLANETAVGIFSTPARLFGTLLFVPTIVTAVTFPRLASTFRESRGEMVALAQSTVKLMLVVTVPLTFLSVGVSDRLLVGILGDRFQHSGEVIAVLSLSLVPTSLGIIANRIIVAADRQTAWTVITIVVLVGKFTLDLFLIPLFDNSIGNPALGAAVGLVLAETAITGASLAFMPRDVLTSSLISFSGKVGVAALAGAGVMAVLFRPSPLAAGGLGCLAYLSVAAVLRVHTPGDVRGAVQWIVGRRLRSAGTQ